MENRKTIDPAIRIVGVMENGTIDNKLKERKIEVINGGKEGLLFNTGLHAVGYRSIDSDGEIYLDTYYYGPIGEIDGEPKVGKFKHEELMALQVEGPKDDLLVEKEVK